ncbi:MAG: tetratricopeptide repeat protein [Alphaproteobacteria bacterium]
MTMAAAADDLFRLGTERHQAGRFTEAVDIYRTLLDAIPNATIVRYHLALALTELGSPAEALEAYRRVVTEMPDYAEAHMNMGNLLEACAQVDDGIACVQRAVALDPDHTGAHHNLARMLLQRGDAVGARSSYRRVTTAHPDFADAHLGLGNAAVVLGETDEAIACFRRAAALDPGNPGIVNNLGAALARVGRIDDAEAILREALASRADNADAHNNLGLLLHRKGRHHEAVACFRSALAARPAMVAAHNNLLFALQCDPHTTPTSMLTEARRWSTTHAAGIAAPRRTVPANPDPERRLRVGYVSPDFRRHAVAHYLEPLIAAHDRRQVEVYCYAGVGRPDEVTARIQASADHWRVTVGLDDDGLARTIAADGIDILVDCAGHTVGNRLLTFARRPAPVQVATLFGFAATTGLGAFDAIFGDPFLTPPGAERHFSEPLVRLPRIIAPFRPDPAWPESAPRVTQPGEGPVFASVTNPARIDADAMGLWQRLLDRVPGARLLVKHPLFDDPAIREAWRRGWSVATDRLVLEGVPGGWAANMDVYGRVDVVLDSPLHSGGMTTLIPLWMGVPVVTLVGAATWRRAGASILANAGLADLLADSPEDYVDKAAALASGERLPLLRRDLRAMLQHSPVCDAALVVGDIEAAYRTLWREACARRPVAGEA